MAKIKIKYSTNPSGTTPTFGGSSGLTTGELAVNLAQNRMFVGSTAATLELASLGGGNTFTGRAGFSQPVYFGETATFNQTVSFANQISVGSLAPYVGGANGVIEIQGNLNITRGLTVESSYINAIAGISTSGITLNGQRITNIVSAVNGRTGAIGLSAGLGITFPMSPAGNTFDINLNYLFGGSTMPSKKIGPEDWIAFQQSGTPNSMYLANLPALKVALYTEINTEGPPTGFGAGDATSALPQFNLNGFQGACGSDPGLTSGFISFTNLKTAIVSDGIVTSFNGRTGAVQGVSAAVAGNGISVSGATGAVTITNTGVTRAVAGTGISVSGNTGTVTITNIGVQSFNGATGAVTGASLGANTFTGLQTSATGFSGPLNGNATTATTATNSTQLGGVAAASYALLASPTFTGTPASTTAAVGTNTTQIATTAFVQNEIVADTVTSFNGRTGAVQGVSAAVAGDGISVSGATGSVTITNAGVTRAVAGTGISVNANTGTVTITNSGVTSLAAGTGIGVNASTGAVTVTNNGVQSFNGATGAVTGASLGANTFTGLQTLNAGIFLNSSTGNTFAGPVVVTHNITQTGNTRGISAEGFLYIGGGATFNSSVSVSSIVSPGATLTIQSGTLSGTARNIRLNPYGQVIIDPLPTFSAGGNSPKLVIQNIDDALGQIQVSGGNLYLGTRTDSEITSYNCDLIFGNPNNAFTTTLTAPNTATSSKTISLPNTTGTVALDAAANTFTALNTFNSGITTSFIYASVGSTFGGTLQVNGGATLAGRVDVGGILDVVGGTTLESTLNVVGVARFAAGVTVSGTLDGTTAAFSRLVTFTQGISAAGGITLASPNLTGTPTTVTPPSQFDASTQIANTLWVSNFFQGALNTNLTFGGDIGVNGGDITTTAATATLFNANATTLSIGGAATTTNLATVASGLTLNIATGANASGIKNIYIGTGPVAAGSARTTVGYNGGLIVSHGSGITLSDSGGGYFVNIRSATTNITGTLNASGSLNSTGLFTTSGGLSAAGGITFNTGMVVTGTVNSSGLLNSTGGISASGGVTFNTPIVSTRMARTSSGVFDTRTASFSPAEADNGKIFVINISGKTSITVTLEGLSIGWRAKFLCLGGTTSFSSTTGNVFGTFGANGNAFQAATECVEVHCYASNTYHAS